MLEPHCDRIEIAGSIRREKPEVKDIEIVAIPKPYDTGLFESGIATVINQWPKVKGELPCKYTKRILPEGIKVDIFFARPENWGLILAIRTGSADYSHYVLARAWTSRRMHSQEGILHLGHTPLVVKEEKELFEICGIAWKEPKHRELTPKQIDEIKREDQRRRYQ